MNHWLCGVAVLMLGVSARAADTAPLLAKIKAVGAEGQGNAEAGQAWKDLVQLGPAALGDILAAFDDNPATANWLRSAVDVIAERALLANKPLPADALEAFVKDTRHSGAGRRLAYEWLARVDPSAPPRLLPAMLHDPGAELRRDAVDHALQHAQKLLEDGDKRAAADSFQLALAAARDRDQVELAVKKLKPLGFSVDLQKHFNFIGSWMLIGPFDNSNKTGFDTPFPPEKSVDLNAAHEGKQGQQLRWQEHVTTDPYAMVDLNKALGKHMGAVAYAFVVVESPAEQVVEIRAGSNNAIKIFLNGKQLYFREEYHHGMRMDQHVGHGTLRPGRNELLLKICQNEQADSWAQKWSFQTRICDALGSPVPVKAVTKKTP